VHQCPSDIAFDVASKAKQAGGFQRAGNAVEIFGTDEAAFPVALLGPWIGIKQIDTIERSSGQPIEKKRGVAVMKAHVANIMRGNCAYHLGHAGDERLDADEAGRWIGPRFVDEVFTAAKADFEADAQWRHRKKRANVFRRRSSDVDREAGKDARHLLATLSRQGLALTAAVKRATATRDFR
jgi:hypothetical protein